MRARCHVKHSMVSEIQIFSSYFITAAAAFLLSAGQSGERYLEDSRGSEREGTIESPSVIQRGVGGVPGPGRRGRKDG